ncbi:MAG TPA: archaellin/type IV pilin N-terminal domain-containing protein [Nitrosopumilaceae archaeon]|nr:archaellin/type IV pilin N-terminal domain-containing protein [Nitrosopumilaceae archaeon]
MGKHEKYEFKSFKKRGVAPVIAHLLLIAIAVIGGTIIFTFSEGFFSSAQISGSPTIESLTIFGYDARAVPNLQMHDGNNLIATSGAADPNIEADDRIAIYITNHSVEKILLGEVEFGGFEYSYVNVNNALGGLGAYNTIVAGELRATNYTILTSTTGGDQLLNEDAGEIKAGQTATLLLDLESDLRIGRSTQLKITTSNGNVFVGSISVGQLRG